MLDGLSKIFRSKGAGDLDGDKPRDAYMDVLREIQRPQTPRRNVLRERAAQVFARAGWGGSGDSRGR